MSDDSAYAPAPLSARSGVAGRVRPTHTATKAATITVYEKARTMR